MTLYRRYYELDHNLPIVKQRLTEVFGYKPPIVLVWYNPEHGRRWLLDKHISDGTIDHVIERIPADEELSIAHNYSESINMRVGLQFLQDTYGQDDHYAIFHTIDVLPHAGTYSHLHKLISNGEPRVIVRWDCHIVGNCFHTNFYAVLLDAAYWCPISKDRLEVLERIWGYFIGTDRTEQATLTNSGNRLFLHDHVSELHPQYPVCESLNLFLMNKPSVWQRIKLWCINFQRRIKQWLK